MSSTRTKHRSIGFSSVIKIGKHIVTRADLFPRNAVPDANLNIADYTGLMAMFMR
jgi:hypothetical protein